MNALEGIDGLSECIGRAIQEHLARSNVNLTWPQIDGLSHPVLRVEAFIEDAGQANASATRPERVASVRVHVPMSSCSTQFLSVYRSDSSACLAS
jgi:ATP-dependent RNA helicase DDX49/DBP8